MDDRTILERSPLPLARGYRRYRNATEVRERHDAAYYLLEIYLKYAASIAIAHYLAGKTRDHCVNAALKGLARPSLGEWLRFLRECLRFTEGHDPSDHAIQGLATIYGEKESRWQGVVNLHNGLRAFRTGNPSRRDKASLGQLLEELVPYRNTVLGHGAPLAKDHYDRFAELFGRAYGDLLTESPFLTARRLVLFDSIQIEEGVRIECSLVQYMGVHPMRREKPLSIPYGAQAPRKDVLYLLDEGGEFICLDPLLIAHQEDVYILNEAEGTPEYLSYATGERHTPSRASGKQCELFERILGYHVDVTRLSRIEADVAPPVLESMARRKTSAWETTASFGRSAAEPWGSWLKQCRSPSAVAWR